MPELLVTTPAARTEPLLLPLLLLRSMLLPQLPLRRLLQPQPLRSCYCHCHQCCYCHCYRYRYCRSSHASVMIAMIWAIASDDDDDCGDSNTLGILT